jgi:hypothetical protein
LASDEANFITGVALPVDGGALVHITIEPLAGDQLRVVATTPIDQRRSNEEEAKMDRIEQCVSDVVAIANGARDHEQAKARCSTGRTNFLVFQMG